MAKIIKAPGRVEIIGNHTDYNGGFVIPAAITGFTLAAADHLKEEVIAFHSMAIGNTVEIPLSILKAESTGELRQQIEETGLPQWASYPLGVAYLVNQITGIDKGFHMYFQGNLPLNAGLSSSASIEAATFMALKQLFPFDLSLKDAALLCQRAENEVAGAPCGNMDQFAVLNGGLTFLDCRNLDYETLNLPNGFRIAVLNTGVKHDIAAKEGYPARRQECEKAAEYLGVPYLRDATLANLEDVQGRMRKNQYMRAHHIITENERVREMLRVVASRLGSGEIYDRIFTLMRASHESSRDMFQNSCSELDAMAEACWKYNVAARLSGGGFGGAVVALVRKGQEQALDHIIGDYLAKMPGAPTPTKNIFEVAQGAYCNQNN